MQANQQYAIEVSCHLQELARDSGYNIGLTGGCLYRSGNRKDIDLIVYPHDDTYSRADFLLALDDRGYEITFENQWLVKLSGPFELDLFFMYRAGGGTGPHTNNDPVPYDDPNVRLPDTEVRVTEGSVSYDNPVWITATNTEAPPFTREMLQDARDSLDRVSRSDSW